MTKYLKQSAVIENHKRDASGQPTLDDYGQPTYGSKHRVKCRVERYNAKQSAMKGQFVNYMFTYYFDDTVSIRNGDKVDGHEVQNVQEYVNGLGRLVGYEVNV